MALIIKNNKINVCYTNQAEADEQCSRPCGIACVPSSTNSVSKGCPKRKRRIKWTKDLHEPFIMIVNRLGGPESEFT